MAVPIGALLVPLEVTRESFVYPANPEVQMWWRIAVVVGALAKNARCLTIER